MHHDCGESLNNHPEVSTLILTGSGEEVTITWYGTLRIANIIHGTNNLIYKSSPSVHTSPNTVILVAYQKIHVWYYKLQNSTKTKNYSLEPPQTNFVNHIQSMQLSQIFTSAERRRLCFHLCWFVCLYVCLCLWTTLRKNTWPDFHAIFRIGQAWYREQSGELGECHVLPLEYWVSFSVFS